MKSLQNDGKAGGREGDNGVATELLSSKTHLILISRPKYTDLGLKVTLTAFRSERRWNIKSSCSNYPYTPTSLWL